MGGEGKVASEGWMNARGRGRSLTLKLGQSRRVSGRPVREGSPVLSVWPVECLGS